MKLPREIQRIALIGWKCAPVTRSRCGFFKGYIEAATWDIDQLEKWSRDYPGCNWTVIPQGSGIFALDIDKPSPDHADDGVAAMQSLIAKNGPLPARPHGRSGGGGHLMVFRDTGHPIRTRTGWPLPGIDPRAGRMGFTVAPSVHRRGGKYAWQVAPWELSPPEAPAWLLKALAPPPEPPRPSIPTVPTTERALRRLRRALDTITAAGPGTRNDTLNKEAFAVARHVAAGKLGREQVVGALYAAAIHSGLSPIESKATIRSGFANGMRHPVEATYG